VRFQSALCPKTTASMAVWTSSNYFSNAEADAAGDWLRSFSFAWNKLI